jgi:hypothetical protein
MIISGNSAEIQRNDLLQENSFKIKATGKAFQILSDGLYADKIKAVIRELSCNAFDAHIAAGNSDVPFTVHLPNALEPHFSVRDYGIGLSQDAVMHIFTTYFESLKNDSNDFIGGLGLGSKSPFSYVDAFTVISRFNGRKSSYTAFIGEDDMPKIAMLGEEDTTEGNGLEVSMPVRSADFREFETKARAVLSRFSTRPEITGFANFEFEKRDIVLEGNGWRLLNKVNNGYGYSREHVTAVAVQGNIAYPLASASMGELKREYQTVLNHPFEFDFNIGELEIAASREALGYKKNTIANLIKAIDLMYAELPTKFKDRFNEAKTVWEARTIYGELFQQQSNLSYLLRELANNNRLTFNVCGASISTNVVDLKYDKFQSLVITRFAGHYHSTSKTVAANMTEHSKFSVQASTNVEFFVNDLPRGSIVRLRPYAKLPTSTNKTVYFIEGEEAQVKAFFKALGNPPTRKTSELPAPVRAAAGPRISSNLMQDNTWGGFSWKEQNDFDPDEDEGYYVHYLRGRPVAEERPIENFDSIITHARALKILSKKDVIVGVIARVRDKLEKNENWSDLLAHLREQVTAKLTVNQSMADAMVNVKSFQEFNGNNYYGRRIIDSIAGKIGSLDSKSPLVKFVKTFDASRDVKANELQSLASLLNVELPVSSNAYDFNKEYTALLTKYPLLSMLQSHNFSENQMAHLIHYINLMDK